MIREWLRHSLALLLVVCISFSHTAQLFAFTAEADEFVPHTTEAFDDALEVLVAAPGPTDIVAYDPDLGETSGGTEIAVQKLEAEHPGTHVVVIPAREKQHATIHEYRVYDPNVPGSFIEVREVAPGPPGILEADIGANIGRLLEAAPPSSTFKKAAGGVAAMADANLLTGNVDQLLATGVPGLSDDPEKIKQRAMSIADRFARSIEMSGQRGISVEFVLDGPVAMHEDIRADATEETWLAIRDLILELIPDPSMQARILAEAAKFVTSPGGLAHQIGAAITRQLEIGLITLVAVGTVLVIVGSGGTLAPAAIPPAMIAIKAYFAASIALNVHDVITSFEYRAVPIGLVSQLELSAARDNLVAFLNAHPGNQVAYANSEFPNRASSAVLTNLLNVLAASGEHADQLQWLDMIPFLIRPPRAADFTISVESGGIVDLPMWCLSSGIDSGLSFSTEKLTYPGIGTIAGTPPNAKLAVLASVCDETLVIPYKITNLLGEESIGRITVKVESTPRIYDAMVAIHPGEKEQIINIKVETCFDALAKLHVEFLPLEGVYVEAKGKLVQHASGYLLQPVHVNVGPDAGLGIYRVGYVLFSTGGEEVAGTLTIHVTNDFPDWNPTSRTTIFDAWIYRGHSAGPLYIMDPDWEQAFCFTATDPDGDVLDFYVNRSPRYGQAGVLASGFAGEYEVHATYMPSYDALMTAHDSNRPLQDSFTIIARDSYGGRDEARVNVQINVLNRLPEANDDDASTDQDVSVLIPVLANDEDVDGDTLLISSVGQPSHGSVSISGTQIRYMPDNGYVGDDAFSYTVDDGHGGSTSASVSIEVIQTDFVPPTITCPSDIDVSAILGSCDASPNVGTASATDNLCTPSVTGVRSDGLLLNAAYPVGTTSILWTARDDAGNTDSCTQTVIVRDEQRPVISGCPSDRAVSCNPGACLAIVSWPEPTVTDNCGIASFASTHSPGDSFAKGGPTTVTYTAIDVNGNTETCSFTVTVLDDEDPVITNCPSDITTDLQPGTCTVPVSWMEPTATDNCDGSLSYASRSHTPGSSFGTGATTVTYEYTDSSGNTDTCSFDVTVNDAVAPTITCPGDMTVGTDADACGATVTYSVTAVDPCGASIEQLEGLPSGSLFPIGTTVNRFRAIDTASNTDICEFSIAVSDDDDPIISGCPGNLTVSCGASQCSATVSWTEPTATDNCGLASFSGDHAAGETFSLGTTTVTYTVIDVHGNRSDCSFTLTVEDNRDPDISGCPGDITVDALFGGCSRSVSWTEPTATDNCDGTLNYTSRSHAPGSSFDIGTTEVTYAFRDSAGNSSQCRFDVTVRDITDPSISCPSDMTVDAETSWGANVYYNAPSASDSCDSSISVHCSPSSGSWFWNGDTIVTCTAEDDSGNEDTCTFEVTVEENHDPVAVNDSVMMSTGQGIIFIDVLHNDYDIDNDDLDIISASTSCGYANVSDDLVEYGTMDCSAPAGSTVTVYYTISDGRGGTASATISVRLPSAGPMSYP